jgi:hypothetical protein
MDKMIQYAKALYAGAEDSFNWYRTLKNTVYEYGILLISLEDFKPDVYLYPRQYHGTKIDREHYQTMSNMLYLFLAKPETCADHSDMVNKLSMYAASTNGHEALCDIMEPIHPLLNKFLACLLFNFLLIDTRTATQHVVRTCDPPPPA